MRGSKRLSKALLLFALVVCLLEGFLPGGRACASEKEGTEKELLEEVRRRTQEQMMDEFDFSDIDESIRKMLPRQRISFGEVVEQLLEGNLEETWELLIQYGKEKLTMEFSEGQKDLAYMLLIAVAAAVFTNFSSALHNKQVSGIGFYVLYLLLITMCLSTFRVAVAGMESQLEMILEFMRILCPGYFLAVAIASGSGSAYMFYNLALVLIYIVEVVILHFILPVINVYIMLQVMNYLLGEDMLSELAQLIKKLIAWMLKTLLGAVIGVNIIQGLLTPVIDTLKRSTLTKTIEALPGIGSVFGGAGDLILGTAVLIKNGIGTAGAVILVLICMAPVARMALMAFLYKLAAALVQPVSDKRITGCIRSVSEGYALMLKALSTTMILFLLTIAVVAYSTS